jgi:hypothetical protein
MKQFKLGFALIGLAGCLIYGIGSESPVAHAAPPADDGFEIPSLDDMRANMQLAAAHDRSAKTGTDTFQASLGVKPSVTPAGGAGSLVPLADGASCGKGMVEVEGDYCPYLEQKCVRWLDPETKMRCAEFAPTSGCHGKTTHKRFCMDQFEFPNTPGQKPVVMTSWVQAEQTCSKEGKRLCTDSEWTLACEGQEHLPYPYGYTRNAEACNIDKPHPDVDEKALANPATRDAEVARLDQRDASGSREACVSSYGVYDMTGNVDEWVVNESAKPFKSGLKGGYWGPVRDRCRPMTTAHNEDFQFYQIGFRCCGEPTQPSGGKATDKAMGLPGAAGTGGAGGVGAGAGGSQGTMLTGT